MKILRYIKRFIVFSLLTILTQIGGLVYLLSVLLSKKIQKDFRFKIAAIFIVLYLITTFLVVPPIAKLNGREKIKHTVNLEAANYLTVLLNRNYVAKNLNIYLTKASGNLGKRSDNVKILYLDACFPFINGFPLLPHLSHNDGKKIDFSLVYQNENGIIINKTKSISGYGVFEEPTSSELNQTAICKEKGYFQYDYPKYLTMGKRNTKLEFSESGTKTLILALLETENLSKIFIEPHLKTRMKLNDNKIRFHGCKAVRHDDHIHIQIKD
jgi:hypothetical protein